jgi:hypothetical protein
MIEFFSDISDFFPITEIDFFFRNRFLDYINSIRDTASVRDSIGDYFFSDFIDGYLFCDLAVARKFIESSGNINQRSLIEYEIIAEFK